MQLSDFAKLGESIREWFRVTTHYLIWTVWGVGKNSKRSLLSLTLGFKCYTLSNQRIQILCNGTTTTSIDITWWHYSFFSQKGSTLIILTSKLFLQSQIFFNVCLHICLTWVFFYLFQSKTLHKDIHYFIY